VRASEIQILSCRVSPSDRSRDIDQRIVAALRRDARLSNVALARELGLSEGAVRRRIENLLAAGAIRFTVVADASVTGLPTVAILRIRCAPHLIDEVIAELRAAPELERAYLTTGPFDITAIGAFESNEALRDFRVNRLGPIAGIVEIQSDIVLSVVEPTVATADEAPHDAEQAVGTDVETVSGAR